MTQIVWSKRFTKDYYRLQVFIRDKFYERLNIYLKTPTERLLNKHYLHGEYKGCFSINITGDYRLIIKQSASEDITLVRIGTHSQLYDK